MPLIRLSGLTSGAFSVPQFHPVGWPGNFAVRRSLPLRFSPDPTRKVRARCASRRTVFELCSRSPSANLGPPVAPPQLDAANAARGLCGPPGRTRCGSRPRCRSRPASPSAARRNVGAGCLVLAGRTGRLTLPMPAVMRRRVAGRPRGFRRAVLSHTHPSSFIFALTLLTFFSDAA